MGRYSTTISVVKSSLSYPTANDPEMNSSHHSGYFFTIETVFCWKPCFVLLLFYLKLGTEATAAGVMSETLLSELVVASPVSPWNASAMQIHLLNASFGGLTVLKLVTNYLLSTFSFLFLFFSFNL